MADITLKTLGDIPVIEPDDSTHLLAEQDGAYARVPKDSVGGGALSVTFSQGEDGSTIVCSHTGEEIRAAAGSMPIVGRVSIGDIEMPLWYRGLAFRTDLNLEGALFLAWKWDSSYGIDYWAPLMLLIVKADGTVVMKN